MTRTEFLELNPKIKKCYFWDDHVSDPQRYIDANGGQDSINFFFDIKRKKWCEIPINFPGGPDGKYFYDKEEDFFQEEYEFYTTDSSWKDEIVSLTKDDNI